MKIYRYSRAYILGSFILHKGSENMLSIYTSYKCNSCGREFVLLSEEVDL